jgi:hypothetical protein
LGFWVCTTGELFSSSSQGGKKERRKQKSKTNRVNNIIITSLGMVPRDNGWKRQFFFPERRV